MNLKHFLEYLMVQTNINKYSIELEAMGTKDKVKLTQEHQLFPRALANSARF
jgi:hypothetical protein